MERRGWPGQLVMRANGSPAYWCYWGGIGGHKSSKLHVPRSRRLDCRINYSVLEVSFFATSRYSRVIARCENRCPAQSSAMRPNDGEARSGSHMMGLLRASTTKMLLLAAASAEFDSCKRPAASWAGFDQVASSRHPPTHALPLGPIHNDILVARRAQAAPMCKTWRTLTGTST